MRKEGNTAGKEENAGYQHILLFQQFPTFHFFGGEKKPTTWDCLVELTHYHTMPHFDAL